MKWITYVLWRHEITSSVPWKRKGRCRFEVSREDVHKPGPYMPPRSPPRHNKNSSVFFLIPEVCTTTYTIQDPFGISRGAGGRKGWRILTTCTKNKKQNVTNSFLIPEIFSRQKCMGKGRRIIPAVAADLSFHLYMHKKTNKRQHT